MQRRGAGSLTPKWMLAMLAVSMAAGCFGPENAQDGGIEAPTDPGLAFVGTSQLLDARFDGGLSRAGGQVEVAALAWRPAAPAETVILLVHGFSGVKENYFHTLPERGVDVGGRLAETGRAVIAIDLPGYGESGGVHTGAAAEVGSGIEDYAFVLDRIGAALRTGSYELEGAEPVAFVKVVGLGVSMGGYTVDATQGLFGTFDAIIPTAASHRGFRTDALLCPDAAVPGCDAFRPPNDDFEVENADPEVVSATLAGYEAPHAANLASLAAWIGTCGNSLPVGACTETLLDQNSQSIDVPVFSILGAEDHIVDASQAQAEPSYFPNSPDAQVLVLEGTGHMVLHHLNHVEVMLEIDGWLDERGL